MEQIARFKPGENVPFQNVGAADIPPGRFVRFAGKTADGIYRGLLAGAGEQVSGVCERTALGTTNEPNRTSWRNKANAVRRGSIARVEAGAAIDPTAASVPVKADATGRAIPQAGAGVIAGYACSVVTAAGQIVEVDLV